METSIIDKGNIGNFEKLLLPEAARMLLAGEAIFALGAVEDGVACGALAGGPRDGRFEITSFFVAQDSRGRGAGTALLDELFRIAAMQEELTEIGCEFTIYTQSHEQLATFLKNHGFQLEAPKNSIVSVALASLVKLPYYKNTKPSCRVYSLAELPDGVLRRFERRLSLEAGPLFDKPLLEMPLDRACSMATLADNEIDGCLLIEKSEEKLLSLAYADSGAAGGAGAFSSMLLAAFQIGVSKYPEDTRVLIQPVTPLSEALVARLAPEAKVLSRRAVRPLH